MTDIIKIFVFIFFTTLICKGQETIKLTSKDSTEIIKTWKQFSASLKDGSRTKIKTLSQSRVDCLTCTPLDSVVNDNFVSIDKFIDYILELSQTSKLGRAIEASPDNIWVTKYDDFLPKYWDIKIGTKFVIYQILFHTYKKNELAQGHEGGDHVFEFIKTNNKFVFYGFDVVP